MPSASQVQLWLKKLLPDVRPNVLSALHGEGITESKDLMLCDKADLRSLGFNMMETNRILAAAVDQCEPPPTPPLPPSSINPAALPPSQHAPYPPSNQVWRETRSRRYSSERSRSSRGRSRRRSRSRDRRERDRSRDRSRERYDRRRRRSSSGTRGRDRPRRKDVQEEIRRFVSKWCTPSKIDFVEGDLLAMDPDVARCVMRRDMSGARNPTGVVISRIKEAQMGRGGFKGPPPPTPPDSPSSRSRSIRSPHRSEDELSDGGVSSNSMNSLSRSSVSCGARLEQEVDDFARKHIEPDVRERVSRELMHLRPLEARHVITRELGGHRNPTAAVLQMLADLCFRTTTYLAASSGTYLTVPAAP
eukprot:Hpha_TRINITY_DN9679_c0_g1::TRINITY_DN9679_c0_g1_i2::g.184537::m.184537